jgi:hypothetical protein
LQESAVAYVDLNIKGKRIGKEVYFGYTRKSSGKVKKQQEASQNLLAGTMRDRIGDYLHNQLRFYWRSMSIL